MLTKNERLKNRTLFNLTFKKRQKISTKLLSLYFLKDRKDINKLPKCAFIVGLRVNKKSTKRNLIKRRMREAYKLIYKKCFASNDANYVLIWVAHPVIMEATFIQIQKDMEQILSKFIKLVRSK
ncbi:MAG: ribonuclease P protein component [Candidatus Melainabacteria bacterium]|nr:ribonuclease P protein component [Candidatus Melainabacteria bacterium]